MGTTNGRAISEHFQDYTRYSELKQLAYNIAVLQREKMFHTLAVLSFFPEEGKTFFCAALAMAYADTCRSKVLVVDTATTRGSQSLALKQCFDASNQSVEVMSLEELRKGTNGLKPPASTNPRAEKVPILDPEVVYNRTVQVSSKQDSDFSIIKRMSEDHSKQYGLVLLDTTPLNAKNRSNIDPLMVAHLSDASVVVVSRKLLNSTNLNEYLKKIEDPSLNLIGMVANEAYTT
jgi:Mrp family chromosome partitioning ATPase